MPDLPPNFTVVSDNEWCLLALLPTFIKRGDVLTRSDANGEYNTSLSSKAFTTPGPGSRPKLTPTLPWHRTHRLWLTCRRKTYSRLYHLSRRYRKPIGTRLNSTFRTGYLN